MKQGGNVEFAAFILIAIAALVGAYTYLPEKEKLPTPALVSIDEFESAQEAHKKSLERIWDEVERQDAFSKELSSRIITIGEQSRLALTQSQNPKRMIVTIERPPKPLIPSAPSHLSKPAKTKDSLLKRSGIKK